jgi:hypothetical protein
MEAFGMAAKWLSTYAPPITARLNQYFPGADFDDQDTYNLMNICGYETAVRNGAPSPWCTVFTKEEWRSNEYWFDLHKYYAYGPGARSGAARGSGWVNELIARLTHSPVKTWPPINSTLDSNPSTFPISSSGPSITPLHSQRRINRNITSLLSQI